MRTLRDINSHILDMSKSTWVDAAGKERTFDPKTWKQDLADIVEQKATLKTKSYYNPNTNKKDRLWWVRWDPPRCREFNVAKVSLPASPVTADRDPYWPEGFTPESNGYFIHGDLVLMKRPYVDHLKEEIEKVKRGKGATQALQDEFEEMTKREKCELDERTKESLNKELSI